MDAGRQAQQRRQGCDRDGAVRCGRQDARRFRVATLLGGAVRRPRSSAVDARLGRPGPGDRGGGAQAVRAAASHVQGQDRRAVARGGPGPATPARLARWRAARELIVDANQAWDETTAIRCLPVLAEIGCALVEQPVPAWNVAGPGAAARAARHAAVDGG